MSERLKRILFAVFFLIFTALAGLAIYYVFFRPRVAAPPTPPPEEAVGELPEAGPAVAVPPAAALPPGVLPPGVEVAPLAPAVVPAPPQTVLLHDAVTREVSLSADRTAARYYNPDDGRFYRVNTDGASVPLANQTFPNLDQVTWGKNTDQAILTFPDGTKLHYSFETGQQTTLPKHWERFDFAPDDKQVVAKSAALTPGSQFLIVTDPNGSNARAIEPLGNNADKVFPNWTPNNQIVAYAMVGESKGFDRQEVIMVGQQHENFRALQVEGRGFRPLWSPSGQKILYSVWNAASDYRPELWISGGAPETMNVGRTKLDLQTWADKCVWADDDTIYCAVPAGLPTGAGLQPDLFTNIPDSFLKIDLQTGAKVALGAPPGTISVRKPVLTADRQHIIFTDALTGKLYDFRIF